MCWIPVIGRVFKLRSRRHRMNSLDMADAQASEKISLHTIEDTEETSGEPELTWRQKLGDYLKTNKIQYTIIALVVLDSVIVIFELLIDMGIITIPENEPESLHNRHNITESSEFHKGEFQNDSVHHKRWAYTDEQDHVNVYVHHSVVANDTGQHNGSHSNETYHGQHHSNKETVEHALHYASLTILTIFVIEVIAKIMAEGKHLLKHKAEVFDAIIVIVSFSMDIAFSFVTVTSAARDAAGLMVLLRLWRITRIINGVIMSVKLDADKKIHEQKLARAKAEDEVVRLKEKINTLQTQIEKLKEQLKKYETGDTKTDSVTTDVNTNNDENSL